MSPEPGFRIDISCTIIFILANPGREFPPDNPNFRILRNKPVTSTRPDSIPLDHQIDSNEKMKS